MSKDVRKPVTTRHDWQVDGLEKPLSKGEESALVAAIQGERYKKVAEEEKLLADVSKFYYKPVDYDSQLFKSPWTEPPMPDNEFVVEEEKKKVRQRYSAVLTQRIFVLIAGLVVLPLIPSVYTLLIAAAFVLLMSLFIFLTIDARQKALHAAEERARKQIASKIETMKLYWQKLREEHEQKENERVSFIKQILEGNVFSLVRYVNQMLTDMRMPVEISADFRLYADTPQIIFDLPSRSTVPMQKYSLGLDGRMVSEAKDVTEINKQHLELCCALIVRILSTVAAASPIFEKFYINGVFDHRCYISVAADKDYIEKACLQPSGLSALAFLEGKVNYEEDGDLQEVEPFPVEEWENAEEERIKVFQLKTVKGEQK